MLMPIQVQTVEYFSYLRHATKLFLNHPFHLALTGPDCLFKTFDIIHTLA